MWLPPPACPPPPPPSHQPVVPQRLYELKVKAAIDLNDEDGKVVFKAGTDLWVIEYGDTWVTVESPHRVLTVRKAHIGTWQFVGTDRGKIVDSRHYTQAMMTLFLQEAADGVNLPLQPYSYFFNKAKDITP